MTLLLGKSSVPSRRRDFHRAPHALSRCARVRSRAELPLIDPTLATIVTDSRINSSRLYEAKRGMIFRFIGITIARAHARRRSRFTQPIIVKAIGNRFWDPVFLLRHDARQNFSGCLNHALVVSMNIPKHLLGATARLLPLLQLLRYFIFNSTIQGLPTSLNHHCLR